MSETFDEMVARQLAEQRQHPVQLVGRGQLEHAVIPHCLVVKQGLGVSLSRRRGQLCPVPPAYRKYCRYHNDWRSAGAYTFGYAWLYGDKVQIGLRLSFGFAAEGSRAAADGFTRQRSTLQVRVRQGRITPGVEAAGGSVAFAESRASYGPGEHYLLVMWPPAWFKQFRTVNEYRRLVCELTA